MTKETLCAIARDDIQDTIAALARAAGSVRAAGFDAVEVLSGTGYLISEFLSPLTSRRQDACGGSLENRMRFGPNVMRAIRRPLGDDDPVIARTLVLVDMGDKAAMGRASSPPPFYPRNHAAGTRKKSCPAWPAPRSIVLATGTRP